MHVNNIWDRLKVCALGKTWPPEFYSWINDVTVRSALETIALETTEDYNNLQKLLESLDVKVILPTLPTNYSEFKYCPPPMNPRDHMCVIGDQFIETYNAFYPHLGNNLDQIKSVNWNFFQPVFDYAQSESAIVKSSDNASLCGSMLYQFDNQIIFASWPCYDHQQVKQDIKSSTSKPVNRFYLTGHIDGWFCPVTPGLIISSEEEHQPELLKLFYKTYFPDYEIVYIGPTVKNDSSFSKWKQNHKWLVPGQENNDRLSSFINKYFSQWTGDITETVFEANMIVVDDKTIITSQHNDFIFKKFSEYGVTAHVCDQRHKMFWDSGVNCAIADLHRS